DQQRHAYPRVLQIVRGDHHLLRAFYQQAGKSDGVRMMRLERLDQILRWNLDAKIYNVEAIILQDDFDQVLANVMDVALHRCENHFSTLGGVRLLHELFEMVDRSFHRFRRLQHFRNNQLVGVEQAAYLGHPLHQRTVNNVQRSSAFRALAFQVFDQSIARALDDVVGQTLVERLVFFLDLFFLGGGAEMLSNCRDVKLIDGGFLLFALLAPIWRKVPQQFGLRVALGD